MNNQQSNSIWDCFPCKKENDSIYTIYFQAKISGEWHLYSQFTDPSGAVPTEFIFNKNPSYKLIRNVQESKPIISYDNYFEMELSYFESNALFSQKVQRLSSSLEPINIELNYQACDDKLCIFRTCQSPEMLEDNSTISTFRIACTPYRGTMLLLQSIQTFDIM